MPCAGHALERDVVDIAPAPAGDGDDARLRRRRRQQKNRRDPALLEQERQLDGFLRRIVDDDDAVDARR